MTGPLPRASEALKDIQVIDLTRVRAGPTCARQFADWGADVIKIEMPEAIADDFSARHDPDFQNLHRGKRSMTLNLKSPEGIEILKKLVESADILIENYRPDVKDRLGIDYETLKKINPRLIYTSISGFGQDGPYRERPGVDQIAQGLGGLMSITGKPGEGPMRVGIPIADLPSGLFGALGTFVALMERANSGQGQWVQTSLLQAQLFMLDFQAARWLIDGDVPGQVGNDHPTGVPTGTYQASDGYFNLAPTPPMWPKFCRILEREDWIDHPDYSGRDERRARRQEVHAMIEEITKAKPVAYWIKNMNEAGIPCGPINSIDQAFEDPQVKHLGIAQDVQSKTLGTLTMPGQPVELSRTPSRLAAATPAIGEHTDEILAELGYGADDIAGFKESGAL